MIKAVKQIRPNRGSSRLQGIVAHAEALLESHPHFHHHCDDIHVQECDGRLLITGRLPSFYLKQLAQEALRGIGVPLVNNIEVVRCDGLSSIAPSHLSAAAN